MATVANVRTDGGSYTRNVDTPVASGTGRNFAQLLNGADPAATNDNGMAPSGSSGAGAVSGFLAQLQSSDGGQKDAPSSDCSASDLQNSAATTAGQPGAAADSNDATTDGTANGAQNLAANAAALAQAAADAATASDEAPDDASGPSAPPPASDSNTPDDANSTDEAVQSLASALALTQAAAMTPATPPQPPAATTQDSDNQAVAGITQATAQTAAATGDIPPIQPSGGPKTSDKTGSSDATAATTSDPASDDATSASANGAGASGASPSSGAAFDKSAQLQGADQNSSRHGRGENAQGSNFDPSWATTSSTAAATGDSTTALGTLPSYSLSAVSTPGANARVAAKLSVSADTSDGTDATTSSLNMLGLTITAKSAAGQKDFTIQITPPDLGRVEVKLSVDSGGNGQATLIVDKPHTLTLLQQDAAALASTLQDAGINLAGGGLNFSLRGQDRQDGEPNASNKNGLRVSAAVDDGSIDGVSVPVGRLTNGYDYDFGGVRLDIRV